MNYEYNSRTEIMSGNQRKLSNFLLTPKFQLKLTYYYIAFGVAVIVSTGTAVFFKMTAVRDIMNNNAAIDFSSQSRISELTFQMAQISLLGFVIFAMASFIFALMVSHRIAGPVLAINDYINEIKRGNYDYDRRLRPNDELTLIMDNLHELNDVLKEKAAN
jgi:signal transduction histidine kinase